MAKAGEFVRKHKKSLTLFTAIAAGAVYIAANSDLEVPSQESRITCESINVAHRAGKYILSITTDGGDNSKARFVGRLTFKDGSDEKIAKDIDDFPVALSKQPDEVSGAVVADHVERVCRTYHSE